MGKQNEFKFKETKNEILNKFLYKITSTPSREKMVMKSFWKVSTNDLKRIQNNLQMQKHR